MQDARTRARESVNTFVAAWLAGDPGAATEVLAPAVRWWTPLGGHFSADRAGAWDALQAVLARTPRPIEATALIVNEDGTRGVVELRTRASEESAVLVTSVVTLVDGAVVEGFTYSDVGAEPAETLR
jgi:ketosteroid isomerase-like protein